MDDRKFSHQTTELHLELWNWSNARVPLPNTMNTFALPFEFTFSKYVFVTDWPIQSGFVTVIGYLLELTWFARNDICPGDLDTDPVYNLINIGMKKLTAKSMRISPEGFKKEHREETTTLRRNALLWFSIETFTKLSLEIIHHKPPGVSKDKYFIWQVRMLTSF